MKIQWVSSAAGLVVIGLVSSCGIIRKTEPVAKDQNPSRPSGEDEGELLLDQNWKPLDKVVLPAVLRDSSQTSKVLDGGSSLSLADTGSSTQPSCSKQAAAGGWFKKSFDQMRDVVIQKPKMELCDGTKARIGVTYKITDKHSDGSASLRWLRYQRNPSEKKEIIEIRCDTPTVVSSATSYFLIDDEKVSVKSLYSGGSEGSAYSGYYSFSRFVESENKMVSRSFSTYTGTNYGNSKYATKIIFDTNGVGDYYNYDKFENADPQYNSDSRYGNISFDGVSGVSFNTTIPNDRSQPQSTRRDFFTASPYASSLIEFDPQVLEKLYQKTKWEDYQSLLTELSKESASFESGLSCSGKIREIECSSGANKSNVSDDMQVAQNCFNETRDRYRDYRHLQFKDRTNESDEYVFGILSVQNGDRLGKGSLFGYKFFALKDGDMVDVSSRIKLKPNSNASVVSSCRISKGETCKGFDKISQDFPVVLKINSESGIGNVTLEFEAPNGLTASTTVYVQ